MINTVFCLMGPTASNKTSLAFELCDRFPFEIVSVDSALVYRGMDIGTAKPSVEERFQYPHYLVDVLDPTQRYSAADFCNDAELAIKTIEKNNKWPLLVGGTMLYHKAFQQGLSALPKTDETLRARLDMESREHGLTALYAKLKICDPLSAERIHPNDRQRIMRALEVYMISGKSLSSFLSSQTAPQSKYQFVTIKLMPDERTWLHANIASRFNRMLEHGFIEEVKGLLETWELNEAHPSMRSVGYRQVLDYLAGHDDYERLKEKGVAATRQLAKRQLTWLNSWSDGHVIPCESKEQALKKILPLLDEFI